MLSLCLHVCTLFQMTCGLKELLLNGQSQEPAVSLFPQLFSCLTVRLGASVGVLAPKDSTQKHTASIHVAGFVFLCYVSENIGLSEVFIYFYFFLFQGSC